MASRSAASGNGVRVSTAGSDRACDARSTLLLDEATLEIRAVEIIHIGVGPSGGLKSDHERDNWCALVALSARPESRERSNCLRHSRRRLRHPQLPRCHREPGRRRDHPTRAQAKPWKRGQPRGDRQKRGLARSTAPVEALSDAGTGITVEGAKRPRLPGHRFAMPAGQWLNRMKLRGQQFMA